MILRVGWIDQTWCWLDGGDARWRRCLCHVSRDVIEGALVGTTTLPPELNFEGLAVEFISFRGR